MPQNSLEQEAMDRVRRMYASFDNARPDRSRSEKKQDAGSPFDTRAAAEPKPQPKPEPSSVPQEPSAQAGESSGSLLDVFFRNQDQSLILLLLVLLMKDGTDMNLMLALMYLLI